MNRRVFAILILLGLPSALAAQQFTIKQLTISPGGGTVSGGEFSVTGKVEQQTATPTLSGGAYSVEGETIAFSVAVHTSGSPRLSIHMTATHVQISWAPDNATGHVLQSSTSIGKGAPWLQEATPSVASDGQVHVSIPLRPGVRFFRLQRINQPQ